MRQDRKLGKFLIVGAIVLIIMQLADGISLREQIAPSAQAQQIPMMNGVQFSQRITQSELPTLVFIHASWCPHCRRQQPVMEQIAKDYQGKLQLLSVSIDKDPNALANYLKQRPNALPTERVSNADYDDFRRALAKTGAGFTGGIPYTGLIGTDGKIIDEVGGYIGYADLKSGLDGVL